MTDGSHEKPEIEPSVCFGILLYVNRSGSTLLSRLLSEASSELFVYPEAGFLLTLLLERRLGRVWGGERLLALIRSDPRRDALAISDTALAKICAETSSEQLEMLLTRIATECHGSRPKAVLLKLESLLYVAPDIETAFTRPAFFHLVRDPRAVASSMLRTPVPEKPGFTMARDSILYAAKHWRRYVTAVETLSRTRMVTELRYESLATAPAPCASILSGLELDADHATPGRQNYRIGAIDAPLHRRVFDDPDPMRLTAWHDELSPDRARIVELLCADVMARRGYDPGKRQSTADKALLRRARVAHWRATAWHVMRTARIYFRRDPSALLRRMALASWSRPAHRTSGE